MTQFFVPGNNPESSEQVYAFVIGYVKAMLDCEIDPVRICSIVYTHEGETIRATVGENDPRTGQLVIAILRADHYLICTPYYGVQRGEPIPVELANVTQVQYFEGLDNAREHLKLAVQALDASSGSMQVRIEAAAGALALVAIGDFPPTMVADFMSLIHKLSWKGSQVDTIDAMSEVEAEHAAAALRALYADVLSF